MGGLGVNLSAEEFGQLFPFHFAFGPDLRISYVGPALSRIYPQIAPGTLVGAQLRIKRPHAADTYAAIAAQQRALFILELPEIGLTLRGQMFQLADSATILFLGAPWITRLSQLGQAGLSLGDFAIHDSVGDLLVQLQTQQTALKETQQLAEQLQQRRSMLQAANQQLAARLEQLEQAHATLDTSNLRLTTLIASMQSGVLVEDAAGKVVLVNQAFCDLFGLLMAPEALIGTNSTELTARTKHVFAEPELVLQRVEALLSAQRVTAADELELVDGRVLERDYVPIVRGQMYQGHLWQYRDISDRKVAEQTLAAARDEALASSQLKSGFLAMVSHEIRTPMNGLIGMSELLLESELTIEQREQAATISEAAHALLTIINDILDYSKIEAGKLVLTPEPLAIRELAESVLNLVRPQAESKGLQLNSAIEVATPDWIVADLGRLRQILLNLIGNAVKFTSAGSVTLRIAPIQLSASTTTLRIEITDTGIGISEADVRLLFQPFSQVDGLVTRRFGGTGLGLAISKSLVELMDGTIGCESTVGLGSTFWFTMRAAVGTAPAPLADAPIQTAAIGAYGARLLVVEDTLMNRKLLLRQLSRLGYEVDVAEDGRQACAMVARHHGRYALVLMDCQMPEMDGYAATRAIREIERERGGHLPIIAITASAMQSERDACLAAGMDDVLLKPLKQQPLATMLSRWLPGDTPKQDASNLLDSAVLGELLELYDGSPAELAVLVGDFFKEAQDRLARLRAAKHTGNMQEIVLAAHALRGSSQAIGALSLATLCNQLEAVARAAQAEPIAMLIGRIDDALTATRRAFETYLSNVV